MLAIIPGNYSGVPDAVWIIGIIVVVLVATAGAWLVIQGILQSGQCERWVDEEESKEEPEIEPAFQGFVTARKKYDSRPKIENKPLNLLDWLSKDQY